MSTSNAFPPNNPAYRRTVLVHSIALFVCIIVIVCISLYNNEQDYVEYKCDTKNKYDWMIHTLYVMCVIAALVCLASMIWLSIFKNQSDS